MDRNWSGKKNILCIRLDNMGDLLMSSPSIRALRESFKCRTTVLSSSMGGKIARYIPDIDDVIISDMPWVKLKSNDGAAGFYQLVDEIRKRKFDAAVIFTVFSQNPMPAIMLAYLAGVPARLAYCRENPYDLLTTWIPDRELFSMISHQVRRDLALVEAVGATTVNDELRLEVPPSAYAGMKEKLRAVGIDVNKPWIVAHPGASETKREYPAEKFHDLIAKIVNELDVEVILTGTLNEKVLTEKLRSGVEEQVYSAAGLLSLEEFMALIDIAPLVLSVNTGTVHIASALKTPVIVLYALTNLQHTPWKTPSKVFTFPVDEELQSRNVILNYVSEYVMEKCEFPDHDEIVATVRTMMRTAHQRYA